MTTEAATTERKRPGRKTNAERAAIQASMSDGTAELTATATPVEPAVPDVEYADPLEAIQAAIDAIPEDAVATWAIEILCQATLATQYRPVFRAAAEYPDGEARVYRLLQVMTRNCHRRHHNQLRMAAAQSVASARSSGRGVTVCEILPANMLANKVADAAKNGCRLQELSTFAGPSSPEPLQC